MESPSDTATGSGEPVGADEIADEIAEDAVEEPIVEEPIAEEPIAEEPIAEEPIAEVPVIEEPAVEEPVAEVPLEEPTHPEGRTSPTDGSADAQDPRSAAAGRGGEPGADSPTVEPTVPQGETSTHSVQIPATDRGEPQSQRPGQAGQATVAAVATTASTADETATVQVASTDAVSLVGAVLRPVAELVTGMLAAVLSPFATVDPTSPRNPLGSLLEFLYAARSRVQSTFFNSTPTVQAEQIAQTGEIVHGTLNAFDADGDELTYTITEAPTHGTVVIHDDGTFTYTPDEVLAVAGGVDTFRVAVSEANPFHMHGLRDVITLGGLLNGVFGLPDAHTATATVAVAVGAVDESGEIKVGEHPQGVALSADGTLAYVTNSGSNTVSVIDTATNEVVATIRGVGNYPTGVTVGVENAYVANMYDNTVTVINTIDNTVAGTIEVGDGPRAVALGPEAVYLYVTNTGDGTVSVIDTVTNTVTATIAVGSAPQHIAVNATGTLAYVTNRDDGTVSVIDTIDNTVTATIAVGEATEAIALSPDGTHAYVTGYDTGTVAVIDTLTNTVVDTIPVGARPDAIAVSSDGTRAYVTSDQDGSVSVIDLASNTVVGAIPLGDTGSAIALGADGLDLYVTNFATGTLTVAAINPGAGPPRGELGQTHVETVVVYNLTDKPVRLQGVVARGVHVVDSPAQYSVIQPGESFEFQVAWDEYQSLADEVEIFMATGYPGDEDYARFLTTFTYDFNVGDRFRARCQGDGGAGSCSGLDHHTIALLGPPGSTATVSSDNIALQSAIVAALCHQADRCEFDPSRQEDAWTPIRQVSDTYSNNTPLVQSYSITSTDTVSQTTSLSISATEGISIKGIVNAAITEAYGHSWTSSHTFSRTRPEIIPRYHSGWMSASSPVYRVYGDFTIDYNGTRYVLEDVYFDTPKPGIEPDYNFETSELFPIEG